jgi:hypothetical protein
LTCSLDELIRRIASPERRALLKDVSPDNALADAGNRLLTFTEPHALDLDITNMSPDEAAQRIAAAARG